jgi:nicotinate-nucleotide pyrophosphorylase (carboxylating)
MKEMTSGRNMFLIDKVIKQALKEDIGNGDITTALLIPENHSTSAQIVAKGEFVVAGLPFAKRVFEIVDNSVKFQSLLNEGSPVKPGKIIAKIRGNTRSILLAERTALNIFQRTSGIATLTNQYVSTVKGLKSRIADTRKTAPVLRFFDKYAVKAGGGHNHRYGLFDGILIKDNHIEVAGGVKRAVTKARSSAHQLLKIEVEVKNMTEVKEALSAGADVIMLDNMTVDKMKKAVMAIRMKCPDTLIEASGNVDLGNVRKIAETGVDIISVGSLTHSVSAADVSLKFKSGKR